MLCCEFDRCDDANAWRKSTKEADKNKFFIVIQKVKIYPCICVITTRTHTKALVSVRDRDSFLGREQNTSNHPNFRL